MDEDEKSAGSDRWNIRVLTRGLDILRALNRLNGATINQLSGATGIPRGTAFRIVKTLESNGYLRFDPAQRHYFPTVLVRGLGDGYEDELWVGRVALPLIEEFTARHKWPIGLSVPHGMRLVLRATTDRSSPFALKRYSPGHEIDLVRSASGRVLLAFCEYMQDEIALEAARRAQPQERGRLGLEALKAIIAAVQRDGYAHAIRPLEGELGLSVPVFVDGRYFASLAMRYIASAIDAEQVKLQYLQSLRDHAGRLGEEIGRFRHSLGVSTTASAPY
jgi:IclR family mhp operon transcriptional activator